MMRIQSLILWLDGVDGCDQDERCCNGLDDEAGERRTSMSVLLICAHRKAEGYGANPALSSK